MCFVYSKCVLLVPNVFRLFHQLCFVCSKCVLVVPIVFCMFQMCFACSKCVSVVSPIVFCMFQMCFGCSNCVLYVPNVFCMFQMCFACSKCVSVVSIVFCMFQMYFQSVYCVNICLKCVKHYLFCVLHLWATVVSSLTDVAHAPYIADILTPYQIKAYKIFHKKIPIVFDSNESASFLRPIYEDVMIAFREL